MAVGERSRRRLVAVLVLVVLSPVMAEYLQAYDESTGDPFVLLGNLTIFIPLYGAPALLIREVVRRRGLDWRGLVLLGTAFGVLQAGVIDQSLFIVDYRGSAEIAEFSSTTWIAPLGLSAFTVLGYVGGHVAYSIAAPIAVSEAIFTDRRPWLRRPGIIVWSLLWLLACALVVGDSMNVNDTSASAGQLVGATAVVVALVLLALRCRTRESDRESVTWWRSLAFGIVVGTVYALASATWWGVAVGAAAVATFAFMVVRHADAQSATAAACAIGLLLPRAVLAFTYAPIFGDVSAGRQWGHHVGMLVLVIGLGLICLRTPRVGSRGA